MTRTAGTTPRADLEAWTAESLRVSTFHAADALQGVANLWQQVVGNEPESSVSNRPLGIQAYSGRHADMALVLQIQHGATQGRIDWISSIFPGTADGAATVSLPRMSEQFFALMGRWLERCPPTNRLAVGAALVMRITTPAEGHEILSRYLNFDIDAGVSSDFHYQANRQRPSVTVPTISINRLTKWSVVQMILQTISITGQGAAIAPAQQQQEYFCRLELDINTVPLPDNQLLPGGRLLDLWHEMVEIGTQIVQDGDVP